MNAVLQVCEPGVVLEESALNLGESIGFQFSEENEWIEGSEMRIFHAIFTCYSSIHILELGEVLERIRFNGGNVVIV